MIALLVALIASLLPLTESANVPTLTWPKGYSASGNIILPYAEINEDFVAYVDLTNNRSRIDSYSGIIDRTTAIICLNYRIGLCNKSW